MSRLHLSAMEIMKDIWEDHNHFVHGESNVKARKKDRERATSQVKELYNCSPYFARRFTPITAVPYEKQIQITTPQLKL